MVNSTFRCHSILWTLLVWGEMFAYTILTQAEVPASFRAIPIAMMLLTLALFVGLLRKQGEVFKTILVFACWGALIDIAILLELADVIDDIFLNLYITVTSILTSIIWCIVSHSSKKSEPAWHWYVWVTILIVASCGAFNNQSSLAQQVYIGNTVLLAVMQCLYIWYTLKYQTPGRMRCKHLWRIITGTVIVTGLLIGSILQKSDHISYEQWEQCVLGVELIFVVVIVIDSVLGFQHQSINYEQVPTNDNTP